MPEVPPVMTATFPSCLPMTGSWSGGPTGPGFGIMMMGDIFRFGGGDMRLTKEQATENRRQILEAASRLFREQGFAAVAVADLMKAAGFTHGGFYNHFPSKEAGAAEACSTGMPRPDAERPGGFDG